jgi:starch-binding outer membrane protein, SusD/RagB family
MKTNQIILRFSMCYCFIFSIISCTNLENDIKDGSLQSAEQGGIVDAAAFLVSAKNGLRGFQDQDKMFAMDEMSSDELAGPTRGGDWDDNAKWRQLHNHTWDASHVEVRNAWNALLSNVYNCNQVIENSSTPSDVESAKFLRAYYYYHLVDFFGQVPYRPSGSNPEDYPLVWTRTEATNFIISELKSILPTVPNKVAGDPSVISKDAVHFLLAKVYLNKAVFSATTAGTYTFAAADMNEVVSNVDAMTSSLAANYWDNFAPSNNTSNELVFTSKNVLGSGGGIQSRWRMGQHYKATPDGWNGFSTVADFYDSYNPNDTRINYSTPYTVTNFGNNVGFLVGQQYAPGGVTPLKDRNNNPLSYTKAVTLVTSGNAIETAGIRGLKYIPDVANLGAPENDYVLMRHSDALLMKAEAIARGGSGSIGTLSADLALRSGQTAVDLSSLTNIYAERGRELWWEGWRRNDMIRFGKFLQARALKPYVSNSKFLLFPIPAGALLNPNMKQNPGY